MSMGFPRQVYWSRWPFPSPVDLPRSGMEPVSPALAGGIFFFFLTTESPGKLMRERQIQPDRYYFHLRLTETNSTVVT